MIRVLQANDLEAVMALIGSKLAENLFLISDIEAFGFDNPIQTVWGQFNDEQLVAILLRYQTNFIPYSEGPFDAASFADIIHTYEGAVELSGLQSVVQQITPYMTRSIREANETYYAKWQQLPYEVDETSLANVRELQRKDFAENVAMLKSIPSFKHGNFSIEERELALQKQTGRTYAYFTAQGHMVASATITAENKQAAMIVGVGTRPGHERNGYATACMERACLYAKAHGKALCLFYHNEAAGRIYKRLGFEDIGMWSMVRYV